MQMRNSFPDKNRVRVSYLLTTRNRAEYLEQTLQNIREFITHDDELIVIDGGSTDKTLDLLERNRDLVTDYISEPDKCEAHAFNKGWRRARGEYVKIITDDDYFYPYAMRQMVETMEAHPEIDALQCGGEFWRVENRQTIFNHFRFLPIDVEPTPLNIYRFAHSGLGLILRTTVLERIGGAAGNYKSVDGDLTVRLAECGCNLRYLDINAYRWYVHEHSTFRDYRRFEKEWLEFDLRLGRWDKLFAGDPEKIARFTRLDLQRGGREFHLALKAIYDDTMCGQGRNTSLLLLSSRLSAFKNNVYWGLRRWLQQLTSSRPSMNAGETVQCLPEHPWNGGLR